MELSIRRLTPVFGAEIGGLEIAAGVDDETFQQVLGAFNAYSVLVLPGQPLTEAQHVAFSSRFGPLEDTVVGAGGAGSKIARVSNVDEDGNLIPPDSQRGLFSRANQLWHMDSSFKPTPAMASLLLALELPPEGGETEFASTRGAYAALPEATKERVENLIAVHSLAHSRGKVSADAMTEAQHRAMPPVQQAMVRQNPVNGAKSLCLGSHVSGIVDFNGDDGPAFHDQLLAFAVQPRFVYRHDWRPDDLLIWDNRAVLHRGRPADPGHRRILHRCTVADQGPTVVDGRIVRRGDRR
jgi:alpha-ketoglutarate-dependent 2,4-dichlorophenoxyacetate dioxygenase